MASASESAEIQGLAEQMQEIRRAMEQLAGVTRLLAEAMRRAPVHLDVEHLQIERVEFNVDGIDVGELGGELNIGITAMQKARSAEPERPDTRADSEVHRIWPPQQKEMVCDGEAGTG